MRGNLTSRETNTFAKKAMMLSSQLFDLMLDFGPEWKVSNVEANFLEMIVDITIEYLPKKGVDPESNQICPIYDYMEYRRWRHLNIMQYQTYICCRVPRVKNPEGKVHCIQVPWADSYNRYTYMFEEFVIMVLQATQNQTKTAGLLGIKFDVVNRIMHNSVERGLKRRLTNLKYYHLSLDEKSFKKGHNYITVLSDSESGIVLDVIEDRTEDACKELLKSQLDTEQRCTVETISMDMWKPFMKAATELLPKAKLTHDRFHLVGYLNKCIDKIRRREVKSEDILRHSRYALLKNRLNLTDKQYIKFESIMNTTLEVVKGYKIRELFQFIFGCSDMYAANTMFGLWTREAVRTNVKEILEVVETFKAHAIGIINALYLSNSNAKAERLNGKIQILKTVGRGYHQFPNFRTAFLFFHGQLELYPSNIRLCDQKHNPTHFGL